MGDPEADRSIVVFGNSHARMWIPAFDEIGSELGYRTYYLVKPNCSASLVTVGELVPGSPAWPECDDFRAWALDADRHAHPDLVVVSSSGPNPVLYDDSGARIPAEGEEDATRAGYVDLFNRLAEISDRALLLRDVPKAEEEPDTCLTTGNPDLGDCMFKPLAASVRDADISEEAAAAAGTEIVDPTKWLCWENQCPVVIGDVLPYRDRGHLTTIYSRELSDELIAAMGPLGGIVPDVLDTTRRSGRRERRGLSGHAGGRGPRPPVPVLRHPDVRRAGAQPLPGLPLHRALLRRRPAAVPGAEPTDLGDRTCLTVTSCGPEHLIGRVPCSPRRSSSPLVPLASPRPPTSTRSPSTSRRSRTDRCCFASATCPSTRTCAGG